MRDHDNTLKGTREMIYSKEQFTNFLFSWIQEARHLKGQTDDINKPLEYVTELVDCLLTNSHNLKNIKFNNGQVIFTEHYVSYEATVQHSMTNLLEDTYHILGEENTGLSTLHFS